MRVASKPLRRMLVSLAGAALLPVFAIALLTLGEAPAEGAELFSKTRIVNLRLADGTGWRAENRFRLYWGIQSIEPGPPLTRIHYRIRYPDGREAVPDQVLPLAFDIQAIHLPEDGAFVAEVWADDLSGLVTPPASISLLLDREPPSPTRLLDPTGWIAGTEAAHLRLSRPDGVLPRSGIRGYAVSIDADPAGSPCAGAERCADEEIDLRGGIEDDSLLFSALPEGRLYAHTVAVSGSGMRSASVITTPIRVDATPPAVSLTGVPSGWTNAPVRLQAGAHDDLSGMAASGSSGAFTALAVDGGVPTATAGGSANTVVAGEGTHRVEVRARDAAGNVSDRGGEPALTATVRIDSTPPRVAFANRPDPGDPERIEATVGDALSGPSPRRGAIGVRPARSRQSFAPLPTTLSGNRLLTRWNPDVHPAGTYEFQASAYDAAGNTATTTLRSDSTRMVAVSGEKQRTSLRAGFEKQRLATAQAPCGRDAVVDGRLTTANGSPLGGEEVAAIETFDAGAAIRRRTSAVRTGNDGSFSLSLGTGPSRQIELAFAGSRGRAPSSAPPLRLETRSCVTLHSSSASASIGGRPVVFRGHVSAPGGTSPNSVPVALQFRLPGLPWSEFRTVATDRHGRFRYPYAFADNDSRGVHFRFRALVAAHDGWPYATGASRPIVVTGR
jgi:hypothetical protein